jgi:serine/threonine protein phosphatase PrpC
MKHYPPKKGNIMFEKRTNDHNYSSQDVARYEELKREVESNTRKQVFKTIFTFCAGVVVATLAIGRMSENK